jgi:hypothetical protein
VKDGYNEVFTEEHALKLAGRLNTADIRELGDHTRFRISGNGCAMNETLRELHRVESLEHILVVDVSE